MDAREVLLKKRAAAEFYLVRTKHDLYVENKGGPFYRFHAHGTMCSAQLSALLAGVSVKRNDKLLVHKLISVRQSKMATGWYWFPRLDVTSDQLA